MTKKSNLLLLSLLVTIGLFIYLTVHHFALKIGLGGNGLCSISSAVNCDAAATSTYAEFFGIPLAVWGACFHFVIFCFVLGYRTGLAEPSVYLRKSIRLLLLLAALASVVMAFISFAFVKVLCPFCAGTYVFSVINLFLGWNLVPQASGKDEADFQATAYFGAYRSHLIMLVLVPLLAWTANGMIQGNYGLDEITKRVPEKIAQWQAGPVYNFDKNVGVSNKVENPRLTLVEFADFKCPHCKVASNVIDAFLKGHPDVNFTYKPYPLDGVCNPAMGQKGDGSRCQMAAYVLCADKLANKGWELHHLLFEKQEEYFQAADASKLLPEFATRLGLDEAKMSECANSAATYEEIKKSADEGNLAKVEGTPTVYMNGKKLPWGQFLEVLNAAAKTAN